MDSRSAGTGALLGLAGGIAGVVAMRYVMKGSQRVLKPDGVDRRESMSILGEQRRRGEDPTQAAGRIMFTKTMRREPSGREKEVMGSAIHWGYGLAMAAGYGLLRGRERHPAADLAGGALFGVGLWGVGDELLIPLLGFGDKPTVVPLRIHAQSLATHVGYGVATAATVQGLRRLMETLEERRREGKRLVPSKKARDIRERLAARFR